MRRSTTLRQVTWSAVARAADTIASTRSGGKATRRSNARTRLAGSDGSNNRPFSPSLTKSGSPPTFDAISGIPRAIASSDGANNRATATPQAASAQKGVRSARGDQLRMLLDAHLTTGLPMDDTCYLHVLNIQMDVCELTGDAPRLAPRRVRVAGSAKQRLKALALNIIGIKGICKVNKFLHHFKQPSRS